MKALLALLLTVLLISSPIACAHAEASTAQAPEKARWTMLPPMLTREIYCFGANQAGTHFLLGEITGKSALGPLYHMTVYRPDSGEEMELFLSKDTDVNALCDSLVSKRFNPEQAASLIEQAGGKEALLLSSMWFSQPISIETAGDLILVHSSGNGYALIDAQTGETTPLPTNSVTLSRDGRAVVCAPDRLDVYDPATGEFAPGKVQSDGSYTPLAVRLLENDAMVVMARSTNMERAGDKMVFDLVFASIGENGAASLVDAGKTQLGKSPERFLYNEGTGVGVAYSVSNLLSAPMYIIQNGGATVDVLLLEGADAAYAKAQPVAQAVGENGELTSPLAYPLMPLGFSADRQDLLLVDIKSAGLIKMNLDTFEITRLIGDEELRALFGNAQYRSMITLTALGYNGGKLLTGWRLPRGCALYLPME